MLRVVVGLGNPGTEYEETAHNVGFVWVDQWAQRVQARWQASADFHGLVAKAQHPSGEGWLWLLKPQTFMNRSGRSVGALMRFYKLPVESLLVVHDELDLEPGVARLKKGGGHGGHNGLRDIHAALGAGDYWRLRLGIGHPGDKDQVAGYVLRKPKAEHRVAIEQAMDRSLDLAADMVAGHMERAMMRLHPASQNPRPHRPAPEREAGATNTGGGTKVARVNSPHPEASPQSTDAPAAGDEGQRAS